MYLELQLVIRERFVKTVQELFNLKVDEPALGFPPSPELGEISITSCFELAKRLRQAPRKIAEQIAARLLPLNGVERISIAGAGYINLHLDRALLAFNLFLLRSGQSPSASSLETADEAPAPGPAGRDHPSPQDEDLAMRSAAALTRSGPSPSVTATTPAQKILVEHTSINPNKAAHIGHLRNAVLGDTLARLLRFRGNIVEVENYIDNTGVQVADVVVGFTRLEKRTLGDVRKLIEDSSGPRFDYYCWDLYARVFQHYDTQPTALALRSETLRAIEEGRGELGEMAELISTAIARLHLQTMQRLNVRYDLLVRESEILRLDFWKLAFELMKKSGAIHFEEAGKNRGCWVMSLDEGPPGEGAPASSGEEDVKVIVRSDGTVTYVGKDIAYHLWKFALLGKDFEYHRFYHYAGGHEAWRTSTRGESGAPAFGRGDQAYSVIDTRQSYLQDIVRRAFLALGYGRQAASLHHFAYEVVGLSPRCAEEMEIALSSEERRRSYVEVSGRKGLGIKADDLIDTLVNEALREVQAREMTAGAAEQRSYATMIAVSALRYFLLKYTRRTIIAFDFREALAFEGETGPYLQYTVVRARNIFRKFQEGHPDFEPERLADSVPRDQLRRFLEGPKGLPFWELILLTAQLEMAVDQAIATEEPATLARYSFRVAQAFNNFYHHHHILHEPDAGLQNFLLLLTDLASRTLTQALDLLGIEIPDRM